MKPDPIKPTDALHENLDHCGGRGQTIVGGRSQNHGRYFRAMPTKAVLEVTSVKRARGADRRRSSAWAQRAVSPAVLTVVVIVGMTAIAGFVGADSRWLAALGHVIMNRGSIPAGVPFAAARTAHWHNAVVLAELVFGSLESTLGDRGLMIAEIIAVAVAVLVLMADARAAGASAEGAGAAVLLGAVGVLTSLTVIRVELFSLALFPILMALLRSDARLPSQRIWLALPLVALWSNLHGAVLVGVAVLIVYLALVRFRQTPIAALGMAVGAIVVLCATPAGIGTIDYYRGLLGNQAAALGTGLWGPLSLSAPLDLLLIAVVVVLAFLVRRSRPPVWEIVVSIGLAAATVHASRSGVWLVMFLVVPAARGVRATRWWNWVMPPLTTVAVVGAVIGVVRGPLDSGASAAMVSRAIALAHGRPILADDVIAEQVALAGGRIWVGDPIDAFTKRDQLIYLKRLAGDPSGGVTVAPGINVVLVTSGSPAQALAAHNTAFAEVSTDGHSDLYVRTAARTGRRPPSEVVRGL
jgi:hypothetical protein